MKRILAIDGGGIRGLFSLEVLKRVEQLFRDERGQPQLVLADVFDLFAGTSTGAIVAAGLCWGMNVAEIEQLYLGHYAEMFTRSSWINRFWKAKYRAEKLGALFQRVFREDGPLSRPALLGTERLRKLLLVVMRNASTGAPWPVTNNPTAVYNDRAQANCNLNIPLWQLLRASTAAPTFYAPERIILGDEDFLFVDGGITPFNNPALIAVWTATLPGYRLQWPPSREALHVVSVGTGNIRAKLPKKLPHQIHVLDNLHFLPPALLGSVAAQQDVLCRILGDCVYGPPLDSEIGDLHEPSLLSATEQKFTYVRYDMRLDLREELSRLPEHLRASLDNVKLIPILQKLGREYAAEAVRLGHFFPRTDERNAPGESADDTRSTELLGKGVGRGS